MKAGPFKALHFEPLLSLEVPRGRGRAGPRAERFDTPQAVAGRIGRTCNKDPQVLVKVTSWGRSDGAAEKNLDYITRDGEIPVENEAGVVLDNRDGVHDVLRGWFLSYDRAPKSRKTMHMVLAMPKGNDPQKVLEGARRFAREEFSDRQYLMSLHLPGVRHRGDVNPEHPHVHLQVKSLNDRGERLRIGPSDLRRMREVFAEKMREQGVRANATSRLERFSPDFPAKGSNPHAAKWDALKGTHEAREARHRANLERMLPLVRSDYQLAIAAIMKDQVLKEAFAGTRVVPTKAPEPEQVRSR